MQAHEMATRINPDYAEAYMSLAMLYEPTISSHFSLHTFHPPPSTLHPPPSTPLHLTPPYALGPRRAARGRASAQTQHPLPPPRRSSRQPWHRPERSRAYPGSTGGFSTSASASVVLACAGGVTRDLQAQQLNPNLAEAYKCMGDTYKALNQWTQAIEQ